MKERGFTTIELLVAIIILSISMVFISVFVVNLKDEKGNVSIDTSYLITKTSIAQKLNYDAQIYGINGITVVNSKTVNIKFLTGITRTIEIVNDNTLKYSESNQILFVRTLNGNKKFTGFETKEEWIENKQYTKLIIKVENGENIELHAYNDLASRVSVTLDVNVNGGTPFTNETCKGNYYNYELDTCKKIVKEGATIGDLIEPTRIGYDFAGWYTATGTKIKSSKVINELITIYAHWNVKTVECKAGEYLSKNTGKCETCSKGYFCSGGTFEYSETTFVGRTKCAKGSYTDEKGQSECIACPAGKTTSGTGKTSCDANCSNNSNVSTWETPSWESDNTITNLCKIKTCSKGNLINNECKLGFTVTYDCNGGGGTTPEKDTNATSPYVPTADNICGYKADAVNNKIYYQTGWSTSKTGVATDSFILTGNTKLYATWGELFIYNKNYIVEDDGNGNWRVKFLESGTLSMNVSKSVDVFVVGGGGAGGGSGTSASTSNYVGGGGGGGGYVKTCSSLTASKGTIKIVVGAGGIGCAYNNTSCPTPNGGAGGTSYFKNTTTCSADGGEGGYYGGNYSGTIINAKGGSGGNGGSGGGGGGYNGGLSYTQTSGNGGENGSSGTGDSTNAKKTVGKPGTGLGQITREFGSTSSSDTLYSGGGAGGGGTISGGCAVSVGSPGTGGGAGGFLYYNNSCKWESDYGDGRNGIDNTGGGGGGASAKLTNKSVYYKGGNGGSGIVIMRNHR